LRIVSNLSELKAAQRRYCVSYSVIITREATLKMQRLLTI